MMPTYSTLDFPIVFSLPKPLVRRVDFVKSDLGIPIVNVLLKSVRGEPRLDSSLATDTDTRLAFLASSPLCLHAERCIFLPL